MLLIIDTSLIVSDFLLKGAGFSILLNNAKEIGIQIVIPELVIDETVSKFSASVSDLKNSIRSRVEKLAKLIQRDSSEYPVVDISYEQSSYRKFLTDRFESSGASFEEYPTVAHKEVAQRAFDKRKPFDMKGRGYRDTLIWEVVKQLEASSEDDVAFITLNTHDFGEGAVLHSDLISELKNPKKFHYFDNLHNLNKELVLPKLAKLDEDDGVRYKATFERAVQGWLKSNLLEIAGDEGDIESTVFELPVGIGSATASRIEEIELVNIDEITTSQTGELISEIRVRARFRVEVDLDWEDYVNHEEVRHLLGSYVENFSFTSLETQATLEFVITVNVNAEKGEVESYEVSSMSGPHGGWSL